jgi:hypothetical protein
MLDIGKSAVRLSLFSFWSAPPYFSLFFCNANDEKKSDLELMTIFGLTMLPDGLNPPVGIVRYGVLPQIYLYLTYLITWTCTTKI